MGRVKMVETSPEYCINCKYHFGGDDINHVAKFRICCDYLLMTGKRRKCPVGKCNKFKPIDEETKEKRNAKKKFR